MNSTTSAQPISSGATVFYCIVMGAILATAIFGNCLVLLAVKRTRSLRNTAAVLVVNLACVDLAVTVFVVPFVIVTASAHKWVLSTKLCVATGFMNSFLTAAQIMALLHISLNRFLAVSYPHSYDTKLSKRLTLTMVIIGWIYSFFWTHMPFYGWGAIGYINGTLFCNILWSKQLSFAVTTQVLCYFIPCFVAGFLYLATYINVRKHWKKAKERTQSTLSLGETNITLAVTQSIETLVSPVTPFTETLTTPTPRTIETLEESVTKSGGLALPVTKSTESLATPVTQSAENVTVPVTQSTENLTDPVTQSAENVTVPVTQTFSTSIESTEAAPQFVTPSTENLEEQSPQSSIFDTPSAKSAETITAPVNEPVTHSTEAIASTDSVTQSITESGENGTVTQSTETSAVMQSNDTATDQVTPSNETPSVTPSSETTCVTQSNGTEPVMQSNGTEPVTQSNGTVFAPVTHSNGTVVAPVTQSTESVSAPLVHFDAASPNEVDAVFLEEKSFKMSHEAAKAAKRRRRKRRAMEIRVTKTLLGVAIAFAVCWFPRGVANLWALFVGRDKVPIGLEYASTVFVFLNSSVNPAIYGALNHDFYKAFISILSCQTVKRTRSDTEIGSGSYRIA